MSSGQLLLLGWLIAVPVMFAGWLWQRSRNNAGIVDALWAGLLAASALLCAGLGRGAFGPRALLAACGGLWGARLALHLWQRVRAESEDGRYRALRTRWQGRQWPWFAFFQFQAALVPLFALPFAVVAGNTAPRPLWLMIGSAIWVLGVSGEALADAQLKRFRAAPENHGRTCDQGMWRYSRHPNYFFEWLHWFSYAAFAVGAPHALLAFSGPLLMYLFLRYLSGIPFTEAQALRTRGASYRAYQARTPMLFPWPPRRTPREFSGAQSNEHRRP